MMYRLLLVVTVVVLLLLLERTVPFQLLHMTTGGATDGHGGWSGVGHVVRNRMDRIVWLL